ncbi:MAG: RING-H2 finger protein [Myxococcota bacterium]
MELFARDQDLVRQATESAKVKQNLPKQTEPAPTSQHPMRLGSSSKLVSVPTLNSWPHFSSISSLNNLGAMTGVKSITSMSGADLASQGNLNKMGNLAKVKSMESMGRNDSYAFLEVFFGDRSSKTNLAGMTTEQRGVKREREDDNDVGLCLDDEGPASSSTVKPIAPAPAPVLEPLPTVSQQKESDTANLKRAYDDALAARGLISVSRSSEDLTDLALPAKMRKTLSQQFLLQHQQQVQAAQQQQQQQQQEQAPAPPPAPSQYQTNTYSYSAPPAPVPPGKPLAPPPSSQQYPGQHPQQQQQAAQPSTSATTTATDANKSSSIEVPSETKCALCGLTGVDTQLRPCGHMFHERCVKPSLQNPIGQPKCPVDGIPMHSAILAVPTDKCKEVARPPGPFKAPAPLGWAAYPPAESTV